MARHWFGGTSNDMVVRKWNFGSGNNLLALAAGQQVTVWDAATGGSRHIDLLVDGLPAQLITADEDGYAPRFQCPDGVQTCWADLGDGSPRRLMVTTDAAIDLSSQLATRIPTAEKGAANGVATLGADSKIPTGQIPDLSATYATKQAIVYRVADFSSAQAALDAAPASSVVLFPPGNTVITTPLSVTKPVTIKGSTVYGTRIVANGCNGIEVAAGVRDFHMLDVEVAAATRYTVTANSLVGIEVFGSTSDRPSYHTYRNVYVDGFWTAYRSRYLWASVFHNFRCDFGLIGMDIYGLSVNNFVSDSSIAVAIVAGSRGVRLAGQESPTDATDVASEGWTFHDSLVYGGEYGFDIIANAHIDIHDCIIDFCQQYGIRIRDNGTNFGGNVGIVGNYIAMTGSGGVAAVQTANTVSHVQNTKVRIHGNHMTVYSGSTCSYGINQSGAHGLVNAQGNTIKNYATADIFLQSSGNTIIGNECLSGTNPAIAGVAGQTQLVADNTGIVFLPGASAESPWAYMLMGGRKVATGLAAPTINTWAIGDRVVNAQPAVGSPKAWVCTATGTPGTWVSEGNL